MTMRKMMMIMVKMVMMKMIMIMVMMKRVSFLGLYGIQENINMVYRVFMVCIIKLNIKHGDNGHSGKKISI